MNLKPMSLGKDNTKNTPSNEGIQAYVKPPTEDDCPKLYIIDGSKSTRFTMSIFRNTFETKNEDIKFKVRPSMLNGASFTSPTNLRIEMRYEIRYDWIHNI